MLCESRRSDLLDDQEIRRENWFLSSSRVRENFSADSGISRIIFGDPLCGRRSSW
jgi:hypothetical protein